MNTVQITWNTGKKTGSAIRKLNGGNLAPNIHGERSGRNIREPFRQLNLAYARLHDAPLDNPGCRLVDISHIFRCSTWMKTIRATTISAILTTISATVLRMPEHRSSTGWANPSTIPSANTKSIPRPMFRNGSISARTSSGIIRKDCGTVFITRSYIGKSGTKPPARTIRNFILTARTTCGSGPWKNSMPSMFRPRPN